MQWLSKYSLVFSWSGSCQMNEYTGHEVKSTLLNHYNRASPLLPTCTLHFAATCRHFFFSETGSFNLDCFFFFFASPANHCRECVFWTAFMASMQRTERFEFGVAHNFGGLAEMGFFDWWTDIEESEKWQHCSFYTLCALYAMVSWVALVQLMRIQLRVPEYGWTTQKVFHLMNFVVTGLRALLFGFYGSVFDLRPKALELMLLELPGLLFFSTYTLLVLFWAEIYHQARNLPVEKLRPTYYTINGLIYLIQVCIWVYIRLSQNPTAVEISRLFFSVISFSAALGFFIYGGRLFVMLRRFPIESVSRQKKLQEVGYVTGICCACFLIRCFMDALSAFDEDADLAVLDHPILILFYYMIVEILPSGLVLFILRKLPPRRVADQYQSIN